MRSFLLLVIACTTSVTLFAQNFVVDNSFHPPLPLRAAYIATMVKQPDGKILVGGEIAFHGQTAQHGLLRINADGSLDNTFSFVYEGNPWVTDIELLSDGDMIIIAKEYVLDPSHAFFSPVSRILRLSSTGSIEKDIATDPFTNAVASQSDGKILVGGEFTNNIRRYSGDLVADNAFNSAVSINGEVFDIKVVSDKIFAAGGFDKVNGVTKNDIVKLNLNGTIDNSFDTGTGTDDAVRSLTFMPDGRILPGQTYVNKFDGYYRWGIVRLNTNGSVDQTFISPAINGALNTPLVTGDGIYIAAFLDYQGVIEDKLFRLKDDGSIDENFAPIHTDYGSMGLIAIPAGDQLVVNSIVGANDFGLSRFNLSGTPDNNFKPEISRIGTINMGDYLNDKLLVGGDFIRIDGLETFGVARLNSNGTVDPSFSLKENKGAIVQLKVLDDNSVLISAWASFFKVDQNGDKRNDFNWVPTQDGVIAEINKFIELPDGKILAASSNTVGRFNADGSRDNSFDLGPFNHSTAFDFDMQGDNMVYGGYFTEILGQQANFLTRVTPQATIDNTFNVGTSIGPTSNEYRFVQMVKVLDNGEILVAGNFTEFDGNTIPHHLVKLSPDGAFDETFNTNQASAPAPEPGTFYRSKIYQLGSKIYIRGISGIYVVNTDGTVNETFNPPITIDGITDMIIVIKNEPDGGRVKTDQAYLYAFGSFTSGGKESTMLKMILTDDESVTGIENPVARPSELSMKIYPQPVSGMLNIEMADSRGGFNASVLDLSGRKSMEFGFITKDFNETTQLDMSQATPGLYLLKVTSASGKTTFRKFAKVY